MPITIERSTLEQIHKAGLFTARGELNVPDEAYRNYLAGLDSGSTTLWADNDFDPGTEPEEHAGVTVCYMCGKVYWITPDEDAFPREEAKGKICLDCLAQGRKVMDI